VPSTHVDVGVKLLVPGGQAKSDNPARPAGIDQYIGRLDVAMHDPARVGIVQASPFCATHSAAWT